jgi:hypothetical protein
LVRAISATIGYARIPGEPLTGANFIQVKYNPPKGLRGILFLPVVLVCVLPAILIGFAACIVGGVVAFGSACFGVISRNQKP